LAEAVGRSALTAFWAFLGLECAAAVAGVVRDPARNIPRATLAGVAAVAALYVAATAVVMGVIPGDRLASSTAPFADAARGALGLGLGAVIAVCALLRATGCLTGWTLVTAETTRSAADVGAFPSLFRTRPGEHASAVNLLAAGGLSTAVAMLTVTPTIGEQFGTLANMAVLLALYCYVLASVSLMRLSRVFHGAARVSAVGTAGVAIACALALIVQAKPMELALAVAPLAAAGLLHLWLGRR
jgi:arginine:agmatine antiporter